MKIRFNETVFRDYSRVGYDSVSITCAEAYHRLNNESVGKRAAQDVKLFRQNSENILKTLTICDMID